MELTVIKIGKPALPVQTTIQEYGRRIASFTRMNLQVWKDEKTEALAGKLAKFLKPGHPLILLDEQGKTYDSISFSKYLQKSLDDPAIKGLVFLIGGPFGHSHTLKTNASLLISLSPMTIQGDIAWLVLVEQIYRAFTILRNIEYHH